MLFLINLLCYLSRRSLLILVMQVIICKKQVEFEIDSSGTFIQQMLVNASESTDETNSDKEQYFIAKNRSRRDIRPPQRYVDLVAYALSVAEKLMK